MDVSSAIITVWEGKSRRALRINMRKAAAGHPVNIAKLPFCMDRIPHMYDFVVSSHVIEHTAIP
jgi:hypothetical protein